MNDDEQSEFEIVRTLARLLEKASLTRILAMLSTICSVRAARNGPNSYKWSHNATTARYAATDMYHIDPGKD